MKSIQFSDGRIYEIEFVKCENPRWMAFQKIKVKPDCEQYYYAIYEAYYENDWRHTREFGPWVIGRVFKFEGFEYLFDTTTKVAPLTK